MPKTPTVYENLKNLVDHFEANLNEYKNPVYKEMSVRNDFINKFFSFMGWDIDNASMKSELNRDVVLEHSMEASGHQVRPDYAFRVNGVVRFFVEAKKPSVDLRFDIAPSIQLRGYSNSSGMPLGILTDFEEFSIYDTKVKVNHEKDAAHTARIFYCNFRDYLKPCTYDGKEYPTTFDFIKSIFSKEAIESGSFDAWANSNTKRGTSEIDKEFLAIISDWRNELADNIAKKNLSISVRDLNLAVQRIIDRLIFLRFAEDRGAERERMLHEASTTKETFNALKDVFESARVKYNSELFEKNEMIDSLNIEDSKLKKIIRSMYFPVCPYIFSAMPLEILGAAYEQFLGKTIRIDGGEKRHKAVVEEKPEVRKAGGVYYTPQYIVEYIVKETVGVKLEGKTPKEAATLTIVDPACGSGSFLIGAYDYLLKWYFDQYTKTPEAKKAAIRDKRIIEKDRGEYRLTLAEKRKILTDSIYGVDIDAQAVEVTKLSLYLKLLEGEGMAGGQVQLALAHEKILPKLDANIKCGNSLIGPDFYDDKDMGLFPDDDLVRINVFDWKASFSEVFKAGGFDCVIGNPPYGMPCDNLVLTALSGYYPDSQGRIDNYELFIFQGLRICKNNGLFSYIIPSPFLSNVYAKWIRKHVIEKHSLKKLLNFAFDVFNAPTVHTCIIVVSSVPGGDSKVNVAKSIKRKEELLSPNEYAISVKELTNNENFSFDVFLDPKTRMILSKLESCSVRLGEMAFIRQCIKSGNDVEYVRETEIQPGSEWKLTLRGKDIDRYRIPKARVWLKYGNWLARNWQNTDFYEREKIVVRETGKRIIATLDTERRYILSSLYSIYMKAGNEEIELRYILGLLNSRLLTFVLHAIALGLTEGAFTKARTNQLARLPIKIINKSCKDDMENYLRLLELVDQASNSRCTVVSGTSSTTEIKNQIIDRQIDQLVYKLYGLTEDEIRIVEDSGK